MEFLKKLKITSDAGRQPVNEPPFEKEVIFKGSELVGLEYEPIFDFFAGKVQNAHKVLEGDFVTTEDGTGIVHIAPGFGEDDFNVCKKNGIGVVCPVDDGGCFCLDAKDDDVKYKLGDREEVLHLNGRQVFETNDDVIKYLKSKNLWVKTEQYLHNYPHCWRTDTPLIYKAVSSWYVNVVGQVLDDGKGGKESIKDRMCELNKQINWIPNHIRDGQFGKWLENARDWSITRNRFWGAPVPVWRMHYKKITKNRNLDWIRENPHISDFYRDEENYYNGRNYFESLIRHAVKCNFYVKVKSQFQGEVIIKNNEDVLNFLGLEENLDEFQIIYDDDDFITEYDLELVPSSVECLEKFFEKDYIEDFKKGRNSGKYIVKDKNGSFTIKRGCFKIDDLHRPYIDELVKHTDGGDLKRVEDVLDCWFESGSMPYAQKHYPFENKEWFENHFPCDFVTEYVAQTRGWFYTMVVLASALFRKIPFKNVICHGVILDANGQKLSKRLRNYPDPLEMIDVYGSDALRWLMVSGPVTQGGDMRIDKDGKMIAEVVKNVLNPIWNAFVFFKQYAELDKIKITGKIDSKNVMDKYILSKLKLFVEKIEKAMDDYNTIDACNETNLFIDVLNNWYIRRSKDRFWRHQRDDDKQQAYEVLHFVLKTFSIALAPLLPFLTEKMYQELAKFE